MVQDAVVVAAVRATSRRWASCVTGGHRILSHVTPEEARILMHEWVASDALRQHMECVAACMGDYCGDYDPEQRQRWIVAGLLHDFDYQRHPTQEEHPFVGVTHLREHSDVDEEIIEAILGHAPYSGVARTSDMARVLFAVDELAGFLVACGLVRPTGLDGMAAKSVRKKLKNKAFAATVSREDILRGTEDLGIDLAMHIDRCIAAICAAGIVVARP